MRTTTPVGTGGKLESGAALYSPGHLKAEGHHQQRIVSLDALRGFDMFWIMGAAPVLNALFSLMPSPAWAPVRANLRHTPWIGFHFWDTIFPLFIFIVGISLSFSMKRRTEKGEPWGRIYLHVLKRALLLFFLGLIYNGFLDFDFANFGYCGVLQRIAIAYFFAAVIVLHTKVLTQALIAGSFLLVYWALLTFVPAPGFGPGLLTPEGNLHAYIDRQVVPGRLLNGTFDEDGLLQQISSIAVALLGAVAGYWLRSDRPGRKKAMGLMAAGAVAVCVGLIWHFLPRPIGFPMIFRLWSSSYALVAAGYASIMLAVFYWIVDVKGYRKWAFPFIVIGMNPLTIYIVQQLFDFRIIVDIFLHGLADHLGQFEQLVFAVSILAVKWLFLYFLYRQKIFLKV